MKTFLSEMFTSGLNIAASNDRIGSRGVPGFSPCKARSDIPAHRQIYGEGGALDLCRSRVRRSRRFARNKSLESVR